MSSTSGPNIATSGLVFEIDMSNTQKSWNGKPTVNYITSPTNEVIATASEFAVFQDLSPIFDTYGTGSYSITADIKTPKPGSITVYTASGGVEYDIGYFSASCDTYYKTFYFNNISVTQTNPAQTVSNLSFYGGYGSGLFPSIKNVQVEKSTYCTPFVVGTRSSTQALLDLTGKNTITSTLTYSGSNAVDSFSFNGSSNGLDISGNTDTRLQNSYQTISMWVNINSVGPNGEALVWGVSGGTAQTWIGWTPGGVNFWCGSNATFVSISSANSYNQWMYVTYIIDRVASTFTWYKNGVYVGVVSFTAYTPSGTTVTVGKNTRTGNGGDYTNGNISSIQLYNRALTASEVAQNFNAIRSRYGL